MSEYNKDFLNRNLIICHSVNRNSGDVNLGTKSICCNRGLSILTYISSFFTVIFNFFKS